MARLPDESLSRRALGTAVSTASAMAILWALSMVTGCHDAGKATRKPTRCSVDSDCAAGQHCVSGECSEADPCRNVSCPEGQVCVSGVCTTQSCSDASCTDPPGDTSCYDLPAPCQQGICRYDPVLGRPCEDGDPCTVSDRCRENGACAGDPVPCDSPGSPYCRDAETLVVQKTPGECVEGTCTYEPEDVQCPGGCVDGQCIGNPCEGIHCDQPPAPECVTSNTARRYSTTGTCSNGVCSYPFQDTYCPNGCQDGECVEDPCANVVCNQPPANFCTDADTLRVYDATGVCQDGRCSYGYEDVQCESGCEGTSCRNCTPQWTDTTTCNCAPTECTGCSGTKHQVDGCGHERDVTCSLQATGCNGTCCAGLCCGQGEVCLSGSCCTPQCAGKECGDDGCGGSCGSCPSGTVCTNGACQSLRCDAGANCLNHGIISYHGAEIGGQFVSWIYILDDWAAYKAAVQSHFHDIRNRFHAMAVRLLLHTEEKTWTGSPGFDFPHPSTSQLAALRDVIDTASGAGLEVVLVVLLPEEYRTRDPDARDDFYAANLQSLQANVFAYWDDLFNGVFASTGPDGRQRIEHVMFVDILGDFDPLNVYGQMTSTQLQNHREWFRRIWPNFYAWYSYIPPGKKSLELVGGVSDPPGFIEQEISWIQQQVTQYNFPALPFYSVEVYACQSWASTYATKWDAYRDLFQRAILAAGGSDHLVVEELGVNRCQDCTNDGTEGESTFSASLSALQSIDPSIPVGIWVYYDSPSCSANGLWGLLKAGGTPIRGWWVIPYYFGE